MIVGIVAQRLLPVWQTVSLGGVSGAPTVNAPTVAIVQAIALGGVSGVASVAAPTFAHQAPQTVSLGGVTAETVSAPTFSIVGAGPFTVDTVAITADASGYTADQTEYLSVPTADSTAAKADTTNNRADQT